MKQNLTFKQRPKERKAGIAHRGVLNWKQASAVFFHELWFLKSWPCGSIVSAYLVSSVRRWVRLGDLWGLSNSRSSRFLSDDKTNSGASDSTFCQPLFTFFGSQAPVSIWWGLSWLFPGNCMNRSLWAVLGLHRPLGAQGEGLRLRIPWLGSFMFLWTLDEAFKNSSKL